jgi:hypothetical protein
MRKFDSYDWSQLEEGFLILMTCEILSSRERMSIADFRDSQALKFKESGNWVGMSVNRGTRLGSGPLRMVDGVWICNEDHKACERYADLDLHPELLSLEMIK